MTISFAANIFNVFSMGGEAIMTYVIGMVVLFASLSIHEYAHAWTADRLGDKTAREMGRLTLNPLAHMDPLGTLFILLGAPVGWAKPVPINPNRFDRAHSMKKGIALVSIAGATSNIILSFVSYFFYSLTSVIAYKAGILNMAPGSSLAVNFVEVLLLIFSLFYFRNIFLAIFNLLPIPPLDGFKFFGSLLPSKIYFKIMRYERYIGMIFLFLLIFARGGLFNFLSWLASPIAWLISTPINALMELFLR